MSWIEYDNHLFESFLPYRPRAKLEGEMYENFTRHTHSDIFMLENAGIQQNTLISFLRRCRDKPSIANFTL